MEEKPTPLENNKIEEDKNEIVIENNEKKEEEENIEEDEIKDDEIIKEEDIKIDEKELDFNDQPEIEIKSEEDLENKITPEIEKIEIDNLNIKLSTDKILDKLSKTKFTK